MRFLSKCGFVSPTLCKDTRTSRLRGSEINGKEEGGLKCEKLEEVSEVLRSYWNPSPFSVLMHTCCQCPFFSLMKHSSAYHFIRLLFHVRGQSLQLLNTETSQLSGFLCRRIQNQSAPEPDRLNYLL